MFCYQTRVKFADLDLAGTVFFANHLKLAHETYEAMFKAGGLSISDIIQGGDFLLPIVHAEADYKRLVKPDELLTIEIEVAGASKCSFTLSYQIKKETGDVASVVKTVHASINSKTHKVIPIPDQIKTILNGIRSATPSAR